MTRRLVQLCAAAALALLAGGCAIVGGPPPPPSPPPPDSEVVVALVDQAAAARRAGRPEQAAAVLERALRIEPGNARLWHRLAELRLEQRQWARAEAMAAKSNQLAAADRALRAANWRIIAAARDARGDAAGARAARERAAME